jgi:hypothetical protein
VANEWDTDDAGFIIFKPVVGWGTAVLAQAGCGLRVQFVHQPEDIGRRSEAIQLAMTPKQARELAQDLLDMAQKAVSVPPGTVPS